MTYLEQIINQCKRAGASSMLRLDMTPEEICRLLHTPQGREFILSGMPTLAQWRLIKSDYNDLLIRYNIYLDSDQVNLDGEAKSIIAIGDTNLLLTPDRCELYQITALHGAQANIHADGWAVVCIEGDTESRANVEKSEHAIVFNSLCA